MKIQVSKTLNGFHLKTESQSLSLSTVDGSLRAARGSRQPAQIESSDDLFVDALFGVVRGVSKKAYYLIVVGESTPIGKSGSFSAREIKNIQILPFPSKFAIGKHGLEMLLTCQ